jgi:hypothetical protein
VVAAIIAGVVLGGIGLDKVIAAPSAGRVPLGNSVTINAAPGWVRTDAGDPAGPIELQRSDAILSVSMVAFDGTSSAALVEVKGTLTAHTAQISFGTEKDGTIDGHDTATIAFEAMVTGSHGSGTVDGEVVCMIVNGDVVVFEAYAPQGDLDPVVDDIAAMVASVEVGR